MDLRRRRGRCGDLCRVCYVYESALVYAEVFDHTGTARCNVTWHERLMWRSYGDGRPPRVMPALGVSFYAQPNGETARAMALAGEDVRRAA
jgi:hypothetical protein